MPKLDLSDGRRGSVWCQTTSETGIVALSDLPDSVRREELARTDLAGCAVVLGAVHVACPVPVGVDRGDVCLQLAGVRFDEIVIPNEIHGFLRYASWLQADAATVEYFDRQLKG